MLDFLFNQIYGFISYLCKVMKILIIDDERSIRNSLKEILGDEGHDVDVAEDGATALKMVDKDKYNAIFCDIKMPGMDGMEVLDKLVSMGIDSAIIMISGHGDIDTAVDCMKKGAFDFIQKPLDLNRILITLKNSTERASLVKENKILKKKVYGADMIGHSEPMEHIRQLIAKVAPTDARVLITGPNSSGKELIARNLHQQSLRSAMPYIEVNCAAIPSELIESELFGHEKGSFTSAVKQHKGKFEQANGGTLFLDEIGDMSLAAQAKVLRVLQERKLSRVGGDTDIEVDVRVVAATNKNLQKEIEEGHFREDLYHRLSVILIERNPHTRPFTGRPQGRPPRADRLLHQQLLREGNDPQDLLKRGHRTAPGQDLAGKYQGVKQCCGAPSDTWWIHHQRPGRQRLCESVASS